MPSLPALLAPALLAAALLPATGGIALAHVTLDQPQAVVGTAYKAVLRVGHGCEGAATTGLRLRIPEGFIAVRPMPKPGWQIETVTGEYAQSYTLFGAPLTSGVTEVVWSGGSLPDDFFDEFTVRGTLAADLPTDRPLYFPVIQTCGEAASRWIQIPEAGADAEKLDFPAPALTLLPQP